MRLVGELKMEEENLFERMLEFGKDKEVLDNYLLKEVDRGTELRKK